jgi:hypothetical protein
VAAPDVKGSGTREDPWTLKTPSGSSEYQMYRDETLLEALGLAEVTHDARNNRMRVL